MNFLDRLLYGAPSLPWGLDRGVSATEFARYRARFPQAFIGFIISVMLLDAFGQRLTRPLQYLIAIVPFIFCIAAVAALVRFVAHWDELQRKIFSEAGALASALGLGLLLTYSYLQKDGFPSIPPQWIVIGFAALWALALPIVRRHYEP